MIGMKMDDIGTLFKNITDYQDDCLEEITVSGRGYLADRACLEKEPSAIIGLAFGADTDERSMNQTLCQTIEDIREQYGRCIPAYVQNRVAVCLERVEAKDYCSVDKDYEDNHWLKSIGTRLDSMSILMMAKDRLFSDKLLFGDLLCVAHPSHMQRGLMCAKSLGMNVYPFFPKEPGWPSSDSEPWVHSPLLWAPRELMTRMLYKYKRYI